MKKFISFILVFLVVHIAMARYYTIGGVQYGVSDGEAFVHLYRGESGIVSIPEKVPIGGIDYPVNYLEDGCFSKNTILKSVTFPSSIMELPDSCFYGCRNLESVQLPSSVTFLGKFCFAGCSRLASINIPQSITELPAGCFKGCTALSSVSIPSSVTSLGGSCFCYCVSLSSVSIPSSVTSLGDGCFEGCESLSSVSIPSSVTSLGDDCFGGCENLSSVSIPLSVTSLGVGCFNCCSSLLSIVLPESITTVGKYCFSGCSSLRAVTWLAQTPRLPERCFAQCPKIEQITLSSYVNDFTFSDAIKRDEYFEGLFENSHVGAFEFYAENIIENINYFYNRGGASVIYVRSSLVETYVKDLKKIYGENSSLIANIKPLKDSEIGESCEKPRISFADGQLNFACGTPDAKFYYTIKGGVDKTGEIKAGKTIGLTAKYNIAAYAAAPGYDISETSEATLIWLNASLDGVDTNVDAQDKRAIVAMAHDGVVTLSGLDDGESVAFYTLDGKLIATHKAKGGQVAQDVSGVSVPSVIIVRLGDQSVKIQVK